MIGDATGKLLAAGNQSSYKSLKSFTGRHTAHMTCRQQVATWWWWKPSHKFKSTARKIQIGKLQAYMSVCFQDMPSSSSCRQIAFFITTGSPADASIFLDKSSHLYAEHLMWLVSHVWRVPMICYEVLKIFRKKDGDNLGAQRTLSCQPLGPSYQRIKFVFRSYIAKFMLRAGTVPSLLLTMPSK